MNNRELVLMNTVRDNMRGYSKDQIKQAKIARDLLSIIGYPSDKDFKSIIDAPMIKNCPVTVDDINRSTAIFGKDVPTLKGKTVRRKPEPVRSELIKVPAHILAKNRKVTLDIDTFYINKLPFLTTLSQHLNFATAQHILNR